MRWQRPSDGASSIAPVELDAFGLHAARGEVAARDLGIFGGDADVAPAPRIVAARHLDRLGDREPAIADAEIERRVDLRIVELHQHVVAGDAEMRRAEGDEGRDVEAAHADDVEVGMVGREAQLARRRDRRRPAPARCRRAASSGIASSRMRPLGSARISFSLASLGTTMLQ